VAALLHTLFGFDHEEGRMFGVLGWILFGLVVGIVAKFLMPGKDPGGIVITTILGIVGAVVGGFLGQALGLYAPGEPAGFVLAILGAMVLLFGYRLLRPART
jgi:uncharacterized membrane protein YeaQ/YmgE (transglycosylase-associated protein family)